MKNISREVLSTFVFSIFCVCITINLCFIEVAVLNAADGHGEQCSVAITGTTAISSANSDRCESDSQMVNGNPEKADAPGTESLDWKSSSELKGFPLNPQQILKHLRTANEVAREAAEFGHTPFGAVLVAPDGEKVLMKQGNLNVIAHAETELSRRAFAAYNPDYLWKCTLVTTIEPCAMCSGNIYWGNIGNLVYGVDEATIKKLTGSNKDNPTMNLPSRNVFKAGQKPIRVVGPVPELKDDILALHKAFWK